MRLLFTGFEPIAAATRCPSWHWASGLAALQCEGLEMEALALPATWDGCVELLLGRLGSGPWDAAICFGAGPGSQLAIERVAVNENDPSLKDAAGRRPRSKAIVEGGEPGFWTGLPYRELGLRLTAADVPSAASHSAGLGLANHVFYRLMSWISESGSSVVGGLVQTPQDGELAYADASTLRRFLAALTSGLRRSAAEADSLQIDPNRFAQRSVGLRTSEPE